MLIPDRIGRYRIIRLKGTGAASSVFEAHDPLLDVTVAVKVLADHLIRREDMVSAFLREARLLRSIEDPRVVAVHDIGVLDTGQPFMVMDLLANFNWDRPIYFAVTTGPDSYINLQDYFQLEGLTYRLVPIKANNRNPNLYGRVATDIMYDNVMDKFLWGGMDSEKDIYLDENIIRMTTNLRLQLSSLADALVEEGKKDKAIDVLDLAMTKMPERNVPYDRIVLTLIESYYKAGEMDKANAITERLFDIMDENMAYYMSLEPEFAEKVSNDMSITFAVLDRLVNNTDVIHKQKELGEQLRARMDSIELAYQAKLTELDEAGRKVSRMRF